METEKQLLDTGLSTEFEEDMNMAIGRDNTEDKYEEHDEQVNTDGDEDDERVNTDDDEDAEQDIEDESILSDENSEQDDNEDISSEEMNRINIKPKSHSTTDGDEVESDDSEHSDASEETEDNKGLWEDIYGRQRDEEGNVISKKYVPPAARVASTNISVDNEKTRRLEKQLKGILNRLAEQNMHTIANQVNLLLNYCVILEISTVVIMNQIVKLQLFDKQNFIHAQ